MIKEIKQYEHKCDFCGAKMKSYSPFPQFGWKYSLVWDNKRCQRVNKLLCNSCVFTEKYGVSTKSK